MRKITPLYCLLLGLIAQLQAQAGRVISYEYQRSYTVQDVRTLLNNFGVPPSLIRPEFDVDVYKVIYETPDARGQQLTIASGAVVIPQGVSCELPLVSYQHGTTSLRHDVPSRGSAEVQLGMLFASAGGFVVSMPDYLGMGDGPGFHPYVHAKSQATASRDMMRAVRNLQDSLNFNLNEQVFLFGYSQGGHATMALFRELETFHSSEFQVTAAAPMSGPYDVSGIQARTITADSAYSTPGYLPYVILGYQEAYGNLYNNLSEVFRSPYDTLIPQLFDGTRSIGYINSFLPDTPKLMLNPTYYQAFENDPNHIGRAALRDNDLYNWIPQAPMTMYYCRGDEQVFYLNTEFTYDTMRALGATQVFKRDFGNLDHGGCLPSCMLQGFFFFTDYRDVRGDLQVTYTSRGVSQFGANDGEIRLQVNGHRGGAVEIAWQDGDTSSIRSGLAAGQYFIRVSDGLGCYTYVLVNLGLSTSTELLVREQALKVYPNPANQVLQVEWLEAEAGFDWQLVNTLGQSCLQGHEPGQKLQIQLQTLPAGVYLLETRHTNTRLRQIERVVVQPQ